MKQLTSFAKYSLLILIVFGFLSIMQFGCQKPVRVISVKTVSVTDVAFTSCTVTGQLIDLGEGPDVEHGFCYARTDNPSVEDSIVSLGRLSSTDIFSSAITRLQDNTKYYVKAFARNSEETIYGEVVSFTTAVIGQPTLTTGSITEITASSATCGGSISDNGGATISEKGICISETQTPTIDDRKIIGTGTDSDFTVTITGLSSETTYYLRAFATNASGKTGYGDERSFTTLLQDVDGNSYRTVKIGFQVWMAENLKTTKYANGDAIADGSSSGSLVAASNPAYWFNYNNSSSVANTYGKLYTWYVINDSRKVCPAGWHVPTDIEWKVLANTLGGSDVAGGKLKEEGLSHWNNPNNANNDSRFTAFAGGKRAVDGTFAEQGTSAYFWTSTSKSATEASSSKLDNATTKLTSISNAVKSEGQSIRCIKDN